MAPRLSTAKGAQSLSTPQPILSKLNVPFILFKKTFFFHFLYLCSNFFSREFHHIASAPNDSYLLSDQDTNRFFGIGGK